MNSFKKMFRSIFVSSDIFKENEEHANIVTASTMFNFFFIFLIIWVLAFFNIFKIELSDMNAMMFRCILLLAIPAIICYANKGKGEWIKHLLFICFVILIAIADSLLKNNVTLIMTIPVILAARYYNKKFTIGVAIATTIAFAISTCTSVNTFMQIFLPKVLVFNIIVFACVQVSQSGKKMIERQQEITKKGARIETELNLANAIQQNMLPSNFPIFPEHKEFDIYASMTPAKEVGGDFYDMFLIDDNHLAFCMADVSGKGIPASLFMMISKILIKNVTLIDTEVDKALTRVNKMLCEGNQMNLFTTCWFGILDLRNGKLEFANAGHTSPIIYSNKIGRFEYLTTTPNMVLAGLENTLYKKYEIQIQPGDRVFLYTDGVIEANNVKNELYGEKRLVDFLNNNLDLSVEETINTLKKDIDKFVEAAEQFDDITMLELLYKNPRDENLVVIQKEFKADIKELSKIQQFAEDVLEKYNCDLNKIMQINLIIEEVFVNIANYAYKEEKGNCTLTIEYDKKGKVILTFEDNGNQFNPLEQKEPDIELSADKREIGGLGILITKKTADDVKYKYENSKNVLCITKYV